MINCEENYMNEEESIKNIEEQRDLDNYYVVVTKGIENQGGNFLYASSLSELDQAISGLEENRELVPMKEALERNYPIQCLNNYEWLHEIADNYVLDFEMKHETQKETQKMMDKNVAKQRKIQLEIET